MYFWEVWDLDVINSLRNWIVLGRLVDDVSGVEKGRCDKCNMEDMKIYGVGF